MSFFPVSQAPSFHRFADLPFDLQGKIIDAALPSTDEVRAYRCTLLGISRWYKSCGRKTIAQLATVSRQWQERVERLLFRELSVGPENLASLERVCSTGSRSLLIRSLDVDIRHPRPPPRNSLQVIRRGLSDYVFDDDQSAPVQSTAATDMLAKIFDIISHWDRSHLNASHLLSLHLTIRIFRNLFWDFSRLPQLPAVGELIVSFTPSLTALHPSASLCLIRKMPRLFHTNINFLGLAFALGSDGDAENPNFQGMWNDRPGG